MEIRKGKGKLDEVIWVCVVDSVGRVGYGEF